MKYTDYKILKGLLPILEDEVNAYLAKGYVLIGGVSSTQIDGSPGSDYHYQAVAKPV